jgi:hypothetical protein
LRTTGGSEGMRVYESEINFAFAMMNSSRCPSASTRRCVGDEDNT